MKTMMQQMAASQKANYSNAGTVQHLAVGQEDHLIRYYPAGPETAPAYIDIHGGGMVWGSMEDGDLLAREMNTQLGVHVLSLDYPLVPDVEYPVPVEYLYASIREIMGSASHWNIDPKRVFIGGRSAGGNLAAVMAILSAQRGEFRFVGQILDHPWLDLCGRIDWSHRPVDKDMSEEAMRGLALGYAAPDCLEDATCTPLNVPVELIPQLPPAIIQTAEFDPLKPEGDFYAELLKNSGISVISHCFPGARHAFTENNDENGRLGRQWIIDMVRKAEWLK